MTEDAFLLALERRALVYEAFGVFWLVAEALILAGVILARRHLVQSPQAERLDWDSSARWLVACLGGAATVVGVLLLARHGLVPTASGHLAATGQVDAEVIALMVRRQREHLLIWSVLVILWVVLESAIVYQGWRAYQVFAKLLPAPPTKGLRASGIGLTVLAFTAMAIPALSVAAATGSALSASGVATDLQAAYEAEAPLRSVAYLVIRVAAVFWIVVEWIAAVYLWKGSRRILFAARRLS